jgi:hypothetical protein
MVLQLIKWEILKISRSTSFGRSLAVGILLVGLGILLLSYVLMMGIALQPIIVKGLGKEDAVGFLNSILIYFFLFEIIYRYFVQGLPVVELESLLHLPIFKSWIIRFLLIRSFISPLSLIPVLLFTPFAVMEIAATYGGGAAVSWLSLLLLVSWSIHWVMLWFKQRFEDSLIGVAIIFLVFLLGTGSSYFGYYNIGEIFQPVFSLALESYIPAVLMLLVFLAAFFLCYSYYRQHAYLEDLTEDENIKFANQSLGLFSRFGQAGEMADLEWKMIIRHKKSRSYLTLSGFFLLYGLIFYANPIYQSEEGFSYMFIFVGSFITGIFMLQYGQLFLSWNSGSFDFFLNKKYGLESLVKGKYLLFMAISALCFLLSVPYVYFGWDILLIHLATFIFNVGIVIHMVIYMALWKPKPMDLNKGGMFNYEGIGVTQFLMVIPLMIAPYVVFLPFALWINDYAGIIALAVVGSVGIFFFNQLAAFSVQRVLRNRYEISSSFRQEL